MSSHRVASRAAEQDDGAFGGEEGEGNNKTHAFDRIRRHAAHAKDESGKGTKNVSPESPLTLQSFRGDANDNVRSHVDPAEEEYERAKYEEEVIKERIRDRESYEKTGKIKSVGTPKKSSLYSHATTTQRGGGNGGGQRMNGNQMTQEELEKLTLEDLAIDSDPEDDVENNNAHGSSRYNRGSVRNASELDISSVLSDDRQSRDTSKRTGTNSRRTDGRSVGASSTSRKHNTRKALQLAQKEALAIESELKKEEDERIAELSKSTAEEDYKLLQAAKERKKEALIARENRKHRERWGLSKDAPVTTSSRNVDFAGNEQKLEPEFELASDNPFDTSGGMIDRILAQNNVTPTASTPPTRRIQRPSTAAANEGTVVEEEKDWFVQLQESLFGCCVAGGQGSGREGKTPEQKAAKKAAAAAAQTRNAPR